MGARHGVPWLTSYLGEKTMRTASLTVLALVAAFLFSVLPAQAAMDHAPAPPTIRIALPFRHDRAP